MKNKKRLSLLLLVMSLIIGSVMPVNAMNEENTETEAEYHIQEDYIVDNEGHKYSNFFNSSGEEVSLEEALDLLNGEVNNQTNSVNNSNSRAAVSVVNGVTLKSVTNKYVGNAKKITQDVAGPMDVSYTVSTTSSASISGSFSATAKNLIFKVVDAEVSVSITGSSAKTESVTVSASVSSGKTGAIYFKPYYLKATGTYSNDGGATSQSFTAYYPRLLSNGFADGLFYLYES